MLSVDVRQHVAIPDELERRHRLGVAPVRPVQPLPPELAAQPAQHSNGQGVLPTVTLDHVGMKIGFQTRHRCSLQATDGWPADGPRPGAPYYSRRCSRNPPTRVCEAAPAPDGLLSDECYGLRRERPPKLPMAPTRRCARVLGVSDEKDLAFCCFRRVAQDGNCPPSLAAHEAAVHSDAAGLTLFVSLSGVAYAATTIGSLEVIDNSLQSVDLKDGAGVTGADVVNDSLQGPDIHEATLRGVGRKVLLTATAGDPPTLRSLGPIGGYTITLNCEHHDSLSPAYYVYARLVVRGPGGDFQSAYTSTINDGSAQVVTASGTVSAGMSTALARSDAYNGFFARKAGTVFVHSGATLLQINFQLFSDARPNRAAASFMRRWSTPSNNRGCRPRGRRARSSRNWSGRSDSNARPLEPHSSALPDCATPRPRNQSLAAAGRATAAAPLPRRCEREI